MYGTGIFLMVDNFNEISYSNFGKLFDTVFVFVSVVCLEPFFNLGRGVSLVVLISFLLPSLLLFSLFFLFFFF